MERPSELPSRVSRVFIIGGAGAVGSMATQILKAKTNAFVIASASRAESNKWCLKMGTYLVVDRAKDVPVQLASLPIKQVGMIISAKTMENMAWIAATSTSSTPTTTPGT